MLDRRGVTPATPARTAAPTPATTTAFDATGAAELEAPERTRASASIHEAPATAAYATTGIRLELRMVGSIGRTPSHRQSRTGSQSS